MSAIALSSDAWGDSLTFEMVVLMCLLGVLGDCQIIVCHGPRYFLSISFFRKRIADYFMCHPPPPRVLMMRK